LIGVDGSSCGLGGAGGKAEGQAVDTREVFGGRGGKEKVGGRGEGVGLVRNRSGGRHQVWGGDEWSWGHRQGRLLDRLRGHESRRLVDMGRREGLGRLQANAAAQGSRGALC